MNIRKATAMDVGNILELLKQLKISGYAEMGIEDPKVKKADNAEEFFKQIVTEPENVILIAEEENKPIGLAVCYLVPKIFDGEYRLLIEEMVVSENYRGKGVGSALLNEIENEAQNLNINVIKLTTGTKLKANEFYKKHGYTHFENAYRKKLN